jgi:hypothetical protein
MSLDLVKDAALQLLQEMSEHQANWEEGGVVHPDGAAHSVGLVPDTPLCDAAVRHLKSLAHWSSMSWVPCLGETRMGIRGSLAVG